MMLSTLVLLQTNYLLHPVGISMKGRNETFVIRSVFQENSYIYSPGLFGRNELMKLEEGILPIG